MNDALTLVRRTRRHVRSMDDIGLLGRVVVVLTVLPLAVRLPWPRVLRTLERLSRAIAVAPGPRAEKLDFYVRACGGLRRGPLQDNCVARSLTRFALLNHPTRPLDVVLGVRVDGRGPDGPQLGRRHVWLTAPDGDPFLETDSVDDYVVQFRYRDQSSRREGREIRFAPFVFLLGASGLASAVMALASVVRTKLVAVGVGPSGLALVGQMSAAVTTLGWITTFGSGGAARFVAEALARGRPTEAAAVARTTMLLLVATTAVVVGLGVLWARPLASLLFGTPAAVPSVAALLAAVPLAAVASAASSVLRGAQRVGRLAAAQIVAAVVAVAACALLVRPGEAPLVVLVPLAVVAALAVSTAVAAWPVCREWLVTGGPWSASGMGRAIAAYGIANLIMGVATAGAFLAIGRHYLAMGDLETAGRIAALAWFGEPLANALVAGHFATTYPSYAATTGLAATRVLTRAVRGVVFVGAPLLGVAAWASVPLVNLCFSPAFRDIAALVALQVLATYVRSVNIVVGLPLLARGHLATVTVLHVAWALTLTVGALMWAGSSASGTAAFVTASAVASGGHLVAQVVVLRARGLAPTWTDHVWLLLGAAPLAWLAFRA